MCSFPPTHIWLINLSCHDTDKPHLYHGTLWFTSANEAISGMFPYSLVAPFQMWSLLAGWNSCVYCLGGWQSLRAVLDVHRLDVSCLWQEDLLPPFAIHCIGAICWAGELFLSLLTFSACCLSFLDFQWSPLLLSLSPPSPTDSFLLSTSPTHHEVCCCFYHSTMAPVPGGLSSLTCKTTFETDAGVCVCGGAKFPPLPSWYGNAQTHQHASKLEMFATCLMFQLLWRMGRKK